MTDVCRVLVVDDEVKIRKLYEQKFYDEINSGRIEFDFVIGGEDALRLLRRNHYDVVYSDINMPGMSGMELLKRVKTGYPHISVIMVTAYGDMENIRSAMNNGAFDFITKPINFDDLKKTLERSFAVTRQMAEAQRIRSDYHGAELILTSILPEALFECKKYSIAGRTRPARIVGGDFFHYMELPDGRITMNIADVCGKGLSAALFMYYVHNLYRVLIQDHVSPGGMLKELNRFIIESVQSSQFVTMNQIQVKGDDMIAASAGHTPLMILRKGKSVPEYLKPFGRPLGVVDAFRHEDVRIQLASGDMVVMYTDGLTEAVSPDGELFGDERLEAIVLKCRDRTVDDFVDAVFTEVDEFAGDTDQFDDMTLLALKMKK